MATKEEAKQHWKRVSKKYKLDHGTRIAWTGDGQGTAGSNFFWPPDNRYIWARESPSGDRPFPVLNRGRVAPAVNVPIILGFEDTAPEEQVLGVAREALPADVSASRNWEIGAHHGQHEWNGGDEVFIDSRQFLPGLVHPTSPDSMAVRVKPFTYFYGKWKRFGGSTTVDFSGSAPSGANYKYVLISLDPGNGNLYYEGGESRALTPGDPIDIQDRNTLASIPAPRSNDIPLGALYLTASTTALGWNNVDNLLDTRLHLDNAEFATTNGQVQVSTDGSGFSARLPLTEKTIGQQLIDGNTGRLLFV